MMKRMIWLILIFTGKMSFAQADTSLLYLKFPTVPPFSITKISDSTKFTKDDLSKKKATLIIVFSPDCEHCQHETEEIKKNIKLFKKVQIVMASPLEYVHIKKFYDEYGIAAYPNIIMGRDPSYFFGTFYKVRTLPSIFLYDKKGRFVEKFEGSAPMEIIASYL